MYLWCPTHASMVALFDYTSDGRRILSPHLQSSYNSLDVLGAIMKTVSIRVLDQSAHLSWWHDSLDNNV
jgi:hypothetical protein